MLANVSFKKSPSKLGIIDLVLLVFIFVFQDVTKGTDMTTPKAARRGRKRKVLSMINHRVLT